MLSFPKVRSLPCAGLKAIVPLLVTAPVTVKVEPSKVRFASPSAVSELAAVRTLLAENPEPTSTLPLPPLTVPKLNAPLPSVCNT